MRAATFTDRPVKVLKFGGSSVGDLDGLRRVMGIVRGEQVAYRTVVVVSATSGTTDTLAGIASGATTHVDHAVTRVHERHGALAAEMLGDSAYAFYLKLLRETIAGLRRLVAEPDTPARTAEILAVGERLSAPLVARGLERLGLVAEAVDATGLVQTDCNFLEAGVDLQGTRTAVETWFGALPADVVPVVTGFIGRSDTGRTTVLGRGGSDYTAALLAEALGAAKFDRWTDIDGLYTADPRRFDGTGRFLYLLLEDASTWNETSRLGMHPQAFEPVRRASIPVHVRSTKFPQGDGTLILPQKLAGQVRSVSRKAMKHAVHRDRTREAPEGP